LFNKLPFQFYCSILVSRKRSPLLRNTNGILRISKYPNACRSSFYLHRLVSVVQDFDCTMVKVRLNKSKKDKSISGLINNHPVLINNQLIIWIFKKLLWFLRLVCYWIPAVIILKSKNNSQIILTIIFKKGRQLLNVNKLLHSFYLGVPDMLENIQWIEIQNRLVFKILRHHWIFMTLRRASNKLWYLLIISFDKKLISISSFHFGIDEAIVSRIFSMLLEVNSHCSIP